ncbi:MAG TPA: beta-ketoacyl-[acyl-carrier-protein] synthase family protein [Polyangiaceae bacterium]|nr:beta-ketoacyl-[acyl-carrier-protein] synthase family protein [Polyangiaceae bacterium]
MRAPGGPRRSDREDIVVTGTGIRCNLGRSPLEVGSAVRAGKAPDFDRWQPRVKYRSRSNLVALYKGQDDLDKRSLRFMGRAARMACAGAADACLAAQISAETVRRYRVAVVVGSGTGDVDAVCEVYDLLRERGTTRPVSPTAVPRIMGSTVAANLALFLGATGPAFVVSAACAGGAVSMCVGALLLRAGLADIAIVGGAEAADSIFHAAFEAARAYTTEDRPDRACRPFSADRTGFAFGEAAGILVLETRSLAIGRNVPPIGMLRGFAMRSNGHGGMVDPDLESAVATMQGAIDDAGVQAADVDYVNAHATGTRAGDAIEVRAMRGVFAQRRVHYSSTKGYTGHCVSAAGAIEAILTLEMLRGRWLASSAGATPLDEEFADYPPLLEPTASEAAIAVSNSFGFGGTYVSLVLGHGPV